MHSPAPLTGFALGMIADLVVAALIIAFLWSWLAPTRASRWIRPFIPSFTIAGAAEWIYWSHYGATSIRLAALIFLAILICVLVIKAVFPAADPHTRRAVGFVQLVLGIYGLVVIVQLLGLSLWRPLPNSFNHLPSATRADPNAHPRVVWVLMDELSYNQVFAQRAPGLDLRHFDAFRQSSTLFSDVQPATEQTDTAVPSLLLGRVVDRTTVTSRNRFLYAGPGEPWKPFPAQQTPFAQAQRLGMITGVVGWHNPYCLMLAGTLDQCYWTETPLNAAAGHSIWQNAIAPWTLYAETLFRRPQRERRVQQRNLYEDLDAHGLSLLREPNADFIFLHLPVPHPPGIYNRHTGQLDTSTGTSYLDNLVLSDQALGQILSILQASPRWSNTSILLCGDHSWRVFTWRRKRSWTHEEEVASHRGYFDPRPMLMVHQAGQTQPATVAEPVPLTRVHDILDSLIRGQAPHFH